MAILEPERSTRMDISRGSCLTLLQSWRWRQRAAFLQGKDFLHSGRVLKHYYDRLPLLLECHASPYGLGAVLSHHLSSGEEKPVVFASRTLLKAKANYSHLEKECLTIVFGIISTSTDTHSSSKPTICH